MNKVALDTARINVRNTNLRLVLSEIIFNGPVDRTQIASRTGLAIATVSRITRQLVEEGTILEGTPTPSPERPGRRNILLDINPAGGYVIGVNVNAFKQSVTLADLKSQICAEKKLEISPEIPADDALKAIATAIDDMVCEQNIPYSKILGIGAASAGLVDGPNGIVRSSPTLGWKNVPLGEYLATELGLEVHLSNLPGAKNLAETRFGIGRGLENVVLLNAALSIGCSMLLDNHFIKGNSIFSGTLGQLPLIEQKDGSMLSAADAAAGWAVLHNYEQTTQKAYSPPPADRLEAILQVEEQDAQARASLRYAGRNMGRLLELVEGITHPELLILAGPLVQSSSYVREIEEYLADAWSARTEPALLRYSHISSEETAITLALHQFLLCQESS